MKEKKVLEKYVQLKERYAMLQLLFVGLYMAVIMLLPVIVRQDDTVINSQNSMTLSNVAGLSVILGKCMFIFVCFSTLIYFGFLGFKMIKTMILKPAGEEDSTTNKAAD